MSHESQIKGQKSQVTRAMSRNVSRVANQGSEVTSHKSWARHESQIKGHKSRVTRAESRHESRVTNQGSQVTSHKSWVTSRVTSHKSRVTSHKSWVTSRVTSRVTSHESQELLHVTSHKSRVTSHKSWVTSWVTRVASKSSHEPKANSLEPTRVVKLLLLLVLVLKRVVNHNPQVRRHKIRTVSCEIKLYQGVKKMFRIYQILRNYPQLT